MKMLHLICNAHIDPAWQWGWDEGAAAAISTFRVAADFCEEFDGFVFNHNEAILYKWIEEYEPHLFKRIEKLVRLGKWNIMGGWYLQPDCNMPSGESFTRQILMGKRYFKEKFSVEPTTAINFDSFGHSRGLIQILKKSGYDSYIFMRPEQMEAIAPGQDFRWIGFDGSTVIAHRIWSGYNSPLGEGDKKVKQWMEEKAEKSLGLVTWGVGNHGGGPSRLDLQKLKKLIEETKEIKIEHSTPEKYFKDLNKSDTELMDYRKGLNPRFVGCYTSQIRIKQKHRLLENELYLTEKMLSGAVLQGFMDYPAEEMREAFHDLMVSEFHDILPGSSVQPVEESSLRLMDHGLEIASRLKARAFFAMAAGQKKAGDGEIPILIYNPHPFKVKGVFECEFMLADQNWKDETTVLSVSQNGSKIPSQHEKEDSNLNLDWRKRVVFRAELEPSQMNRFNCKIEGYLPKKAYSVFKQDNGKYLFKNDDGLEVVINCKTGLIDAYRVDGVDYIKNNAFLPVIIDDNDDPWRMDTNSFGDAIDKFSLMSSQEGTVYSGVHERLLDSVRVIEDGDVRTVIEAVLKYNDSFICQRYKLPKKGTGIEISVRVNWNEKSKMLKLSVPTLIEGTEYVGQTAFGVDDLPCNRDEVVAQKWVGVLSRDQGKAITLINDGIYGSDFSNGEVRLSLLRSPGFCGHPIEDRTIMPQDRFSPRIDQGERLFSFVLNAGEIVERLRSIDREALVFNEKPFALSFFPSGEGKKDACVVELQDDAIQMTAFKKAEDGEDYIIRLFEPTGNKCSSILNIPVAGIKQEIKLDSFEVKTLRLIVKNNSLAETDLMERENKSSNLI